MALYTERHGLRTPVERTSAITVEMYYLLLDCCKKYYKHLTHLFPQKCHDDFTAKDYLAFGETQFQNRLKIRIPTLFRDEYGRITSPSDDDKYDQYALLDLIEFIAQNMKDISEGWNNQRYQNYWNIECLSTSNVFSDYQREINEIFAESGLLYTLTTAKIVERVLEYSPLTSKVETVIHSVKEKGLKYLLEEAVTLFKQPDPASRNDAVEKLWDAFERMKTYYTPLDKKRSAARIVTDMSGGQIEFTKLFEDEFKTLTDIGNGFRIRHHETDKIDITDSRHFDYIFNRCMSLIASALQYLN